MRNKIVQGLLALGMVLLLAACGTQFNGGAEQGVTVAGVVGGTVSNPTLAGAELDLSTARVTVNDEGEQTSVVPGVVIEASGNYSGNTLNVRAADVRIEVKGPIASIDTQAMQLSVVGQTVTADANTHIYGEGPDDAKTQLAFADLQVGDYVEVSGVRDASGAIMATMIERKQVDPQDSDYSKVEIVGTTTNLDTAAKTFQLGGLTVDYAGAEVEGVPAEGAFVKVKGTIDPDSGAFTATKVKFKNPDQQGHAGKIELCGPITGLDEAAQTFGLLEYTVDYSTAVVEGQLADGLYVKVKGTPSDSDPSLIQATKVKVKDADDELGKVEGPVESLDAAAMLITVSGQTFWADASTIVKQDDPDALISFAQIQVGDRVTVKYDSQTDADGHYHAAKIKVEH